MKKVFWLFAGIIIYQAIEDTRIAITALREREVPVCVVKVENGQEMPLNSAVDWIGKGSYIIIISTPVDTQKWNEYFKKYVLPDIQKGTPSR